MMKNKARVETAICINKHNTTTTKGIITNTPITRLYSLQTRHLRPHPGSTSIPLILNTAHHLCICTHHTTVHRTTLLATSLIRKQRLPTKLGTPTTIPTPGITTIRHLRIRSQ